MTHQSDSDSTPSLTPIMEQYYQIKRQHAKEILLFRMGDFYEMFGEDAERAAPVLGLTLTSRAHGKSMPKTPLAGVPFHTVDRYIRQLLKAGFQVAVCDQVEDPRKSKGIVKRQVVEVITPGTILLDDFLEKESNNYLVGLYPGQTGNWGLAKIDLSTGEFEAGQIEESLLSHWLDSLHPAEIIHPEEESGSGPTELPAWKSLKTTYSPIPGWKLNYQDAWQRMTEFFRVTNLKGFGLEEHPLAIQAAAAILVYLEEKQQPTTHVRKISLLKVSDYMILDGITQRNLELVESFNPNVQDTSLLGVINKTVTPMGSRLLRQWIQRPLISIPAILERQKTIRFFYQQDEITGRLRENLHGIGDLERLLSRLTSRRSNGRDLLRLNQVLKALPDLQHHLPEESDCPLLQDIRNALCPQIELVELIDASISEEAPLSIREGGIIRRGWNSELDELQDIAHHSKAFIARLEKEEIANTGINSLKIRYNRVFGYFIEITKSNTDKVPDHYIRRQTMVNAERYVTPELKEMEDKILNAEERIFQLEEELFQAVREQICGKMTDLQEIAAALSRLDVILALAFLARVNYYHLPEISPEPKLVIQGGRHPVVEELLKEHQFVPNDLSMNNRNSQIIVITGPNMAGKSTYLRMVALLTVMAQMGSYVPAESAVIGIADRIFTRVGASDNLARGESTFLVEMSETANILNNAGPQSLIILDEVGRGTSTFDGLSLAWALVEYLHNHAEVKARTLFATHYHELTELETLMPDVKNYNVLVKKIQNRIVFLRKIVPGASDQSYGIEVAALAGIPGELLDRAREILAELEEEESQSLNHGPHKKKRYKQPVPDQQLSLFTPVPPDPWKEKIVALKLDEVTPIQAWQFLAELQKNII